MHANQQQEEQGEDYDGYEDYEGGFWAAHDQFEQGGAANDAQDRFGENAQDAGIQDAPDYGNNQGDGIQEAPNNNNNQGAGIQEAPNHNNNQYVP